MSEREREREGWKTAHHFDYSFAQGEGRGSHFVGFFVCFYKSLESH